MMPLYLSTDSGCGNGKHVFLYTTTTTNFNADPAPFQRCSCGKFTWRELQRLVLDDVTPLITIKVQPVDNATTKEGEG